MISKTYKVINKFSGEVVSEFRKTDNTNLHDAKEYIWEETIKDLEEENIEITPENIDKWMEEAYKIEEIEDDVSQ